MQALNHVTAIALICWLLCCLIFIDVCLPWPNDVAVLDQRMWFWLRFELKWWCMPLSLFFVDIVVDNVVLNACIENNIIHSKPKSVEV